MEAVYLYLRLRKVAGVYSPVMSDILELQGAMCKV
jgi:hypothetical protein